MRALLAAALLLLLTAAHARAGTVDAERAEVAREHFQAGEAAFAAGRWQDAIVEYELARVAFPSGSIDLQIGRTWEKLGRIDQALDAYRRYLHAEPGAANALEIQAHVLDLEAQRAPRLVVTAAPPERASSGTRLLAPALVAGLAAVAFAAGGVLVGITNADVDRLRHDCAPRCAPSSVSGLPERETAGYALVGIGAAAAVVDVVLFVLATRPRARASTAARATRVHATTTGSGGATLSLAF
jgi:tetratricopeptide (TPR) repeat protein